MIVERDACGNENRSKRGSFSVVLRELAAANRLAAYEPGCALSQHFRSRPAAAVGRFSSPAAAALLDRDGLINRKAPAENTSGGRKTSFGSRRRSQPWNALPERALSSSF